MFLEGRNKKTIIIISVVVLVIFLSSIFYIISNFKYSKQKSIEPKETQIVRKDITENLKNNNFVDALDEVDDKLNSDQDDVGLLLLKANILLDEGSMEFKEKEYALRAQKILDKVISFDPNNVLAYQLMGYSYEIQNMFDEALKNYNKSLSLEKRAETYNWKGHTYDLMGDIVKAEEFYKKAIELDGSNRMALRNLSRVYLRLNKQNEAQQILQKLIKMPVDNINAVAGDYHSLGTIEFNKNNIDKAETLFKKALEIDPSFMLAQVEMAKYEILFEGKKDEAIVTLKKIMQNYPRQVAPVEWLGFAYLENDQIDESIKQLKRAIEMLSGDITLMGKQRVLIKSRLNYYLSIDYSLKGNTNKAKECLFKSMEGTNKTTMTMLINSLREGENGPYKNLMSDPDIVDLSKRLNNLNK